MNKVIYVLEDDPDISYILTYLLSEEGYEVHAFATVSACRAAVNEFVPDLLLLDVQLPDGNGIDLCTELKSNLKTASSPVLMMSASLEVEKRDHYCANDFIPKPFNLDHMVDKIGRYFLRQIPKTIC